MGSLLGGGSSTTNQSSSPPPQVLANYQGLVNRATGVANTPYTAYPGEQVAPLSNQTNAGLANIDQYAYSAQPYLNAAGQMVQQGSGMVSGGYGNTQAGAWDATQGMGTAQQGLGGIQQGLGTTTSGISGINQGLNTTASGAGLIHQGYNTTAGGLSGMQTGLGMTQGGAGEIKGAMGTMPGAEAMTTAAAKPVSAQQFSGKAVDQYSNPYTQDVIRATQNEFNNQNAQQAQFLNSQNIGAGAFGGDRAGISQSILANQQNLAQAPVIAGLNQANYNQALAEFNNQQQTNLGASEYNTTQLGQMGAQLGSQAIQQGQLGTAYGNMGTAAANIGAQQGTLGTQQAAEGSALGTLGAQQATEGAQLGTLGTQQAAEGSAMGTLGTQEAGIGATLGNIGAQQGTLGTQQGELGTAYGNVGTAAQTAGLQGAGAQTQAGMIPQAEQQAIDTSLQNNWNQAQAYPFQTTGFLGNIIEGTGSQTGGTSSTTSPGPSGLSQAVGLGTAAVGALSNPAVTSGLGSIGTAAMAALPFFARGGRIPRENEEPVGRTFDGRAIHRFNYRGDPRSQIGLAEEGSGLGGLRGGFQGGGNVSPGQLYDLGIGKAASPAGALAMTAPGSGAGAGTGAFGAGTLSRTPAGTLMHATPDLSQWAGPPASAGWGGGAPSPLNPSPAGPAAGPRGPTSPLQPRIGHQTGGAIGGGDPQMSGFTDYGYLSTATPGAIAQGYGVPDPMSGVPQMEYSALTGGASGGSSVPANAFTEQGTESLKPSLPNLGGAAPGTVFKPIDYQHPLNNFQTANAEASLGPHYFTTGKNGELVYGGQGTAPGTTDDGTAPQGTVNKGSLLNRPGVETAKTENTPAATVTVAASSPQDMSATTGGANDFGDAGVGPPVTLNGGGGGSGITDYYAYNQALSSGRGGQAALATLPGNSANGGRIGRQDGGGLGGLPSYYTPETGNARSAHYNPAVPPPPTPQSIYVPRHIAPRPAPHVVPHRAQVPLPPPRPLALPDVGPFTPAPPLQRGMPSLPALNPDETKDPFVHYPDASYPQPSMAPQVDPDPDRAEGLGRLRTLLGGGRPSYQMGGNAGMLGQMPLAGATGYTPPGQGVTGMDSQGSPMGSGSAKAAGFDGLFGSGFQRGGRIGFDSGGLAGLGMQPGQSAIAPTTDVDTLIAQVVEGQIKGLNKTIPDPPKPPQQPQQSPGQALTDGLKNIGTNASHLTPTEVALAPPAGTSSLDIQGLDLSQLDGSGGEYGLGGVVRRGFDVGGTTSVSGQGAPGSQGVGVGFGFGSPSASAPAGTSTNSAASPSQGGIGLGFGQSAANVGPSSGGGGGGGVGAAPGGSGPSGGVAGATAVGGGGGGGSTAGGTASSGATSGSTSSGGGGHGGGDSGGNSQGVFGGTVHGLGGTAEENNAVMKAANAILSLWGVSPAAAAENAPPADPQQAIRSLSNAPFHYFPFRGDLYGQNVSTDPLSGVAPVSPVTVSPLGPPQGNGNVGDPGPGGGVALGTNSPTDPGDTPGPGIGLGPGNAPSVVANPGGEGVADVGPPAGQPSSGLGNVGSAAAPVGLTGFGANPAGTPGAGAMGASNVSGGRGLGSYQPPRARGGRTSLGFGGIARQGFLEGGDTTDAPPDAPPTAPAAAPAPFTPPTRQQVFDYNAKIAPKYGNNPAVVAKVLGGEMGTTPYQVGDAGSSFGPWQLHKGGMNPAMGGPGMGDEYTKETGHDPNDPHYWQEQSDFAQKGMAKQGLTPWTTTMGKLGLNKWSARDGDQPAGGGALAFAGGGEQNQQQQQFQSSALAHADPETKISAAMEDATRTPDRQQLQSDFSMALMYAGFSMMGGNSKYAAENIGKGAMEGIKYMQAQRQLDREWQLNEAKINELGSESRYHDAQTKLETRQLDIGMAKIKLGYTIAGVPLPTELGGPPADASAPAPSVFPTVPSSGGAQPPVSGPQKPAVAPQAQAQPAPAPEPGGGPGGGAKPAPAPPADAAAPTATGPTEFQIAMQELQKKYTQAYGLEFAGGPAGAATAIRQQIVEAQKTGQIVTPDGRVIIDPDFQEQEARKGALEQGQKEFTDEESDIRERLPGLQTQQERMTDLETILHSFTPGAGAQEIAKAQLLAQRMGLDWGDPSGVYAAAKVQSAASFDIVGKMKGQVRNMELQGAGKQVPGPEMPLNANLYLINRMKGALQQESDFANAFLAWRDTPEGQKARTPNLFAAKWYVKHPYKDYIDQGLASFRPKTSSTAERPPGVPTDRPMQKSSAGNWRDPATGETWDSKGNKL